MKLDRKSAIEYLKDQMPDYLTANGLPLDKHFKCVTGTHNDANPSMIFDKKDGQHVKCFSCDAYLDIFDLSGIFNNTSDFNEQLNYLVKYYNIELENGVKINETAANKNQVKKDTLGHTRINKSPKNSFKSEINEENYKIKAFIDKAAKNYNDEAAAYLLNRGISEETAKLFNIGYSNNYPLGGGKYMQAIIIPTGKYSYTARNIDSSSKDRIRKKGATPIFNAAALYNGVKPVFIVEGEIDVLSVIEAGGQAVGLGSKAAYNRLLEEIKENTDKIKSPLIIALDNEEQTTENTANLKKELEALKLETYTYNPYGKYKDANETLISDRDYFIQEIQSLKDKETTRDKLYRQENSSIRYLKDFINGLSETANTVAIETGFKKLDKALDGGLYEGLYTVGAVSTLGKTTLLMQMADQIAANGQDVLIFSLEMARSELISKSISRNTFLIEMAKPNAKVTNIKEARDITVASRYKRYSEEEIKLIKDAIDLYSQYAGNILIDEGIGDISVKTVKERVKKHIEITGRKPVVIIDYLQILSPYDIRATDKQNTDKAVLELKRLSRDYKIPVIGISSLNRDNYKNVINMAAFKESGAIEYTTDVLIGLQYKGTGQPGFNEKEAKKGKGGKREIELHILKNRNGETGQVINYSFYAAYNTMKEE